MTTASNRLRDEIFDVGTWSDPRARHEPDLGELEDVASIHELYFASSHGLQKADFQTFLFPTPMESFSVPEMDREEIASALQRAVSQVVRQFQNQFALTVLSKQVLRLEERVRKLSQLEGRVRALEEADSREGSESTLPVSESVEEFIQLRGLEQTLDRLGEVVHESIGEDPGVVEFSLDVDPFTSSELLVVAIHVSDASRGDVREIRKRILKQVREEMPDEDLKDVIVRVRRDAART